MRYFLQFSYHGKNYFGYQIQPNDISVQEVLEEALSTILQQKVKITAAGRTDTGVHAKKMFAHFDAELNLEKKLIHQLNSFLPPDIAVQDLFAVNEDFHARFDATFRTYQYHISLEKNPFTEDSSWQLWRRILDVNRMNEASKILLEYSDFTSFSKVNTETKTNICRISTANWELQNNELIFTITADRFLRNMVRAIVGTLVEIGAGKYEPAYLKKIIEDLNRCSAGTSAPAKGLFLVDVGYNWEDKRR
ncbi:tRNA pseudouridine(38-40) synthase TruA [Frigoriflavimonas asaccharolytica]|uniref:tRNA pseudouridine synthase A n=1 Tax=Frigoriflavimonas asaccharolytica TaxID=2735899 RepID=A0A8J8KAA2_9FLAO|nr:tRNA pseudouridine(38-40) synthase TruA [Frigoriflavimonas asaccharolytica]NRS93947.1 tRNA pseudouridine38-40 synthase [Frigoriflavimonas asaccharolytica]